MYKQAIDKYAEIVCVIRTTDSACIPFDPANTDYAEFKKAVTAGAELQDVDGNVMTAQAAQEFVRGLP
jgi:hypothetical protein